MHLSVLEPILTVFIVFAAPLPWWLILLHLAAQRQRKFYRYAAYVSIAFAWVALGYAAFRGQEMLFLSRFQSHPALRALGIASLLAALLIDFGVMRSFGLRRLTCLSELRKNDEPGVLVTSGVFAYARHPRYVEFFLWFLGAGLVSGYAFLLGFAVYLFLSFWLATYFEEAELVQRFGQAYRDYQKRVPRFFVRLKSP